MSNNNKNNIDDSVNNIRLAFNALYKKKIIKYQRVVYYTSINNKK